VLLLACPNNKANRKDERIESDPQEVDVSLRSKPWLIAAIPAIGLIWIATAVANFYTGYSYGSKNVMFTIAGVAMTTGLVFGVVSVAADILGSLAAFATRTAWRQRLWLPMTVAAVIGAMCISWSLHSAHRFIILNITSQEAPATQNEETYQSILRQLRSAEKAHDEAGWVPLSQDDKKNERRATRIRETKADLDAARKSVEAHEPVTVVPPLKNLEILFAVFLVFVANFGTFAFLSSPAAPKSRTTSGDATGLSAVGNDQGLSEKSNSLRTQQGEIVDAEFADDFLKGQTLSDLRRRLAALEAMTGSDSRALLPKWSGPLPAANDEPGDDPTDPDVLADPAAAATPVIESSAPGVEAAKAAEAAAVSQLAHATPIASVAVKGVALAQPLPDEMMSLEHFAVRQFFEDCTEDHDAAMIQVSAFAEAYNRWAREMNYRELALWKFGQIASQVGITKRVMRASTVYPGLRIKSCVATKMRDAA
jgi:hypothetical protein